MLNPFPTFTSKKNRGFNMLKPKNFTTMGMSTSTNDMGKSTLKDQELTLEKVKSFLLSNKKLKGMTEMKVAVALAKHFGVTSKLFMGTRDYLDGTLTSLLRTIRSELAPKKADAQQTENGGGNEVKLTPTKARKIVAGLSPETFEMEKGALEAYVCEQLGIPKWDITAKYAQKMSFAKFLKSCRTKVHKVGGKKKQKLMAEPLAVKQKKESADVVCCTLGPVRTVEDVPSDGWTNTSDVARQKKEKKEQRKARRKQWENAARTIQQMARAKLAWMKEKQRLEKAAETTALFERQRLCQLRLQVSITEDQRREEEENRRFCVEFEEMIDGNREGWLKKFNKSWKGNRGEWADGRSQEAVDELVRLYEELSAFVAKSACDGCVIDSDVVDKTKLEINRVVGLVKKLIDDYLQIVKLKWEHPTQRKDLKEVKKKKKGKKANNKSAVGDKVSPAREMKFPKYLTMIREAVSVAIKTWTSSNHSTEAALIGKLKKELFWACAHAATGKKTSKKSSLRQKGKWRLKALVHQMRTGTALPNPNYVEQKTAAVATSKKSSFNDRRERRTGEVQSWMKKDTYRFVKAKSEEEMEMAKQIVAKRRLVDENGEETVGARKYREKLMRKNAYLGAEEAQIRTDEKFEWKMKQVHQKEIKKRARLRKEAHKKRTTVGALQRKDLEKEARKKGMSVNYLVRQTLLRGVKGKASTQSNAYELKKKQNLVDCVARKQILWEQRSCPTNRGKVDKKTKSNSNKTNRQHRRVRMNNADVRKTLSTRDNGPKRRSQQKKADAKLVQAENRLANRRARKAKEEEE
jgi:hypothetical protein